MGKENFRVVATPGAYELLMNTPDSPLLKLALTKISELLREGRDKLDGDGYRTDEYMFEHCALALRIKWSTSAEEASVIIVGDSLPLGNLSAIIEQCIPLPIV